MKYYWMYSLFFLLFMCSTTASDSITLTRPACIVPRVSGISLVDSARYSIISSISIEKQLDCFELVLFWNENLSEKNKMQIIIKKYLKSIDSLDSSLMPIITQYRNESGRMTTTFSQGELYAIQQKMGLDSYIKARYLFIAEITEEYDFSHLSLSIDNNIPVILQDGGNIYLCLAYDDSSITVADMAKVTGSRVLPGWSSRVTELKKAKNLSDSDQKWLEEHEEKLRTGDYQSDYIDYYFIPCSTTAGKLNRPFLSRLPRDSFQGKMTIITPPKMEFDKIIKRFGGW